MKYSTLKNKLEKNQKGTFHSMVWERPCKTKKAFCNDVVTKRSTGVVRLGIQYDNMKDVQAKRQTGELPAENQGLQWGSWDNYPYTIENKGKKYLRCATAHNNKINRQYFLNGKEVDFETVEPMLLASEKKNTENLDVFTVDIENIIAL